MKALSRRTIFVVIALFIVVDFALIIWATKKDSAKDLAFNPDQASKFVWMTEDRSQTFDRPISYHPWMPAVAAERIQNKLLLLKDLKLSPMPVPKISEVQVRIELGSAEKTWGGVFHDGKFVWNVGPAAGQGARLDESQLEHFLDGRFAFEELRWSWCDTMPVDVFFEQGSTQWRLQNENGKWRLNVMDEPKKTDKATVMQWLEKACPVTFTRYLDLKLAPLPQPDGILKVRYQNGMETVWRFSENWVILSDDQAGQSQELLKSLRELQGPAMSAAIN